MKTTRIMLVGLMLATFLLPAGCARKKYELVRVANFLTDVKLLQICNDVAREIERENPGLRIRIDNIPYNEYQQKLATQVAAGGAPDVVYVEVNNFVDLYSRGILEDLTPLIERDQVDLKAFYPGVTGRFTRDGRTYALPQDTAPSGLVYYNKNVFDEMGVPYPTDDWSWPEPFLSICKKLVKTDAKGNKVRWAYSDAYPVSFESFMFSLGGNFVDDTQHPTRVTLDSPEALKAARFRWDLMHTYRVSPTTTQVTSFSMGNGIEAMFMNGQIAMMSSGIWHTPKLLSDKNLEFDVVMFPKGPTGKRGWSSGGSGYAITRGTKNKDLAWKVVRAFTSEAAQRKMMATGFIQPALVKLAESPEFLQAPGPANRKVLLGMTQDARYQPFLANWPEIWYGHFQPALDQVWIGDKTPEQVLPGVVRDVNKKFFGKK